MNYLHKELIDLVVNDPGIFEFIHSTSLDGMWYWDLENPENEWMNERFWQTLGYDPEKMPHKASAWQNIIFQEDLETSLENFHAHCKDLNHPYDQIVRYKHATGKTVWIRCKGVVIRDENGTPKRMLGSHVDVTSLQEAQHALRERIERYDQIISSSQTGTWEWNIITDEFIHNDQWVKIFGYTQKNIDSPTDFWRDHLHPEDIEVMETTLKEHLKGNIPTYQMESRIKRNDDQWRWILIKGQVIERDTAGMATWLRGSIIDITERKNNELLLKRYKDLLEKANEVARIGTWEYDLVTGELQWSHVTSIIHDVPEGFVPSVEEAFQFYPTGENRDKIVEAVRAAAEEGKGYDLELQIKTYTGNLRWVRAIGIPELYKGKCVRLYGLFQDIHDSKEFVDQLAFQEELFRQAFENAPGGMALFDTDGGLIRVNRTACNMLGYDRQQLKNATFTQCFQAKDENGNIFDPFSSTNDPSITLEGEVQVKHKDGGFLWVRYSLASVMDLQGGIKYYVYQFNNISRIKQAQAEIDGLLKQTQKKNEQLLNFANIVSHNLRSNSANLQMFLDIITLEKKEFAQDEIFPMLEQAVSGLKTTIDNLQDVVEIQTETSGDLDSINLYDAVNASIYGQKAVCMKAGVSVENNVDPKQTVKAVPAYLDSIISNLLSNAIKYRSDKRASTVTISSELKGKHVVMTMADNGLGMDLELIGNRVFGMYKTFHGNKDARGIGLFLVKSQVEAMGGEIEVASKVDVGTEFKVTLLDGKA